MTFEAFRQSLELDTPPALPPLLEALWWDRKGSWDRAHQIAQDISTPEGSWVHAYLHRKEGDIANARYWYGQAGRPVCRHDLEAEWQQIAKHLLDAGF